MITEFVTYIAICFLTIVLVFFYLLMIAPHQEQKNRDKKKRSNESSSRELDKLLTKKSDKLIIKSNLKTKK